MATDEVPDDPNPPEDDSGGNFLTNRMGPLPMWGWIAVVVGAVVVYKIIKSRSGSSGAGSGTVAGQNNAASLFGTEGFSTNSAGQLVDNATGDILGSQPIISGGSSGSGTTSATSWFTSAQQTLFNLGYDNSAVDQALQDFAAGNKLPQNEYGIIEAAIKLIGNPPTGVGMPELQPITPVTPPSSGGGGGGGTPSAPSLPPYLNAQSFPLQVLFGSYGPNDYTQVGTVNNGTYSGAGVLQGAPVYAGLFGGFEQDFNMSSLPNGTKIYVPTSLYNQGYVSGHPAQKAA